MSHYLNQKYEQNKSSKNSLNSKNYLNDPTQKKFKIIKNKEPNLLNINLLFFENNNITSKQYFKEKRKEEMQKNMDQNKKENLNNQIIKQPLNLMKQNQENLNNIDDLDNSRNSFFSSDFSEENENNNEREEIIKKLSEITDDITFIDFDIFNYSKMMLDDMDILSFNQKKIEKNEMIDNCNLSTHTTDINNSKIELIEKAKNSGLKYNEKRTNKFKRNINKEIIDKSKSIKRTKERSRSRYDYKKY